MKYIITFYKRILFLLLIYSSTRILFYIFNSKYFSSNIFYSLIEGIRFDISAIFYINLPILLLLLIPFNLKIRFLKRKININRKEQWYKQSTNILFYILNIPFLIANIVDIAYYQFSLKRTTSDIFEYLTLGGGVDAFEIIPRYLIDYWYVTIIIIIQIILLLKIKYLPNDKIKSFPKSIILFLLSIGIFILGARGGTQLKPIKPIDAGLLSDLNNSILVLNTPFCILHTILKEELRSHNYFEEDNIKNIYNTQRHSNHTNFYIKNKEKENMNIVIIILESFSKEFIGEYNKGYTPFLDELMKHSLVMENGYSNGIKSIEALPAITASIPTLMDNPFITSSYATNQYDGIATILEDEGYSTSFFHGGQKGTMGFYQFSKKAGFQKYFGMEEYNNIKDYDGTWGIYDEPFFKYHANYLKSEKKPFMSCLFSATSHPPYDLPKNKEGIFPKGSLEIHESIGYTDFALKEFFEQIKEEEWYKNTLFVITSDHTSPESDLETYKNKIGRYSIPIVYFMGDSSLNTKEIREYKNVITQQIDIMPTILDIINYPKPFFSFGKSIFSEENWAISFINNEYLFVHKNGFLISRDEDYTNFSDKELIKVSKKQKRVITLLKAIKQTYNNSLIKNQIDLNEN